MVTGYGFSGNGFQSSFRLRISQQRFLKWFPVTNFPVMVFDVVSGYGFFQQRFLKWLPITDFPVKVSKVVSDCGFSSDGLSNCFRLWIFQQRFPKWLPVMDFSVMVFGDSFLTRIQMMVSSGIFSHRGIFKQEF